MQSHRKFVCQRDRFDSRDHIFVRDAALARPESVDLRPSSLILDQGELGSCVWNATAAYAERLQPGFWLSRLGGYYWTRVLEGTTRQDAGCEPRDAMKILTKRGAAVEADWPYDVSKFRQRPPHKLYVDAKKDLAWEYQRLVGLDAILDAFAMKLPVLFGATLYPEFESDAVAKTGMVPMPSTGEREIGGHAFLGLGYHTASKRVICQNSWGVDWGDHGFFYLPFDYVASPQLLSDAWVLRA